MNHLYDTSKSSKNQNTNYTTFQNFNFNSFNSLKDKDIYSVVKLQYTLVQDFLSKINLSYTLKSFNNEIKTVLNPTTPFTNEEISKLIYINPNENDKSMKTDNTFEGKLKSTYLYNLIYSKSNLFKEEKEVQTFEDGIINTGDDDDNNDGKVKINNFFDSGKRTKMKDAGVFMREIDEKLKKIDEKYEKKVKNENFLPQSNHMELKFINYKNELEKKYKEELKNEIERIKLIEVGKIIIEENKKYLEKIEAIRNEYESKYELKNNELIQKEKDIKEKKNHLENDYEEKTKELIKQYQERINKLNEKESNFNIKCIKELKNIKEKKMTLDKKEKELYILKKDYYKEMEKEVDKIKKEFKQIFKDEIQKIRYENEQELEKEKNKLKLTKINYDINILKNVDTSQDNDQYIKEILLIKEELKTIKAKMNKSKYKNLLLIDNEIENEKISENLDYYEKLSDLELKLNEIMNKTKFKFYKKTQEEEKNVSNLIIKDENIQKKFDQLEKEQNELNKQIDDLKKDINDEVPKIKLTQEEIDTIKDNNYNLILYNLAKDKELNEIYKKQSEEEYIKNKIKFINKVNENVKKNFERERDKEPYIIIDVNEMEKNKQLYLKLYRQRGEQQKIDEINKQKEKIRQRELKEKEIKEREKKEKEEREKNKYKIKEKEEEKSMYSKSIQLPPVRNPRKSSVNEIEDLINKSKIRIASASSHINLAESTKIQKNQKIDEKKEDEKKSDEEDNYGSGDFVDLSNEEKKSKSKIDNSKKEKEIHMDEDLSGRIDMILNESHTDKISESNNKDNSESYNDFENSDALDKKGIVTEKTEEDKSNKSNNEKSIHSSSDYKF
jgi:hypothetical protein